MEKARKSNKSSKNKFVGANYVQHKLPKKGGKFRKICAPNKQLKMFQRSKLRSLERLFRGLTYGTPIQDVAHGFIKGRSPVTAAERHIGYQCTVMMDISEFFDNCFKKDIVRIIDENGFNVRLSDLLFHEDYAAQGFVTSPILANIAITPALRNLHSKLSSSFDDFVLTIYADDIQVSLQDTAPESISHVKDLVHDTLSAYGFKVNKRKTRTRFAKYGYRRILGINVGDTEIRGTRKTMRKYRAAMHQGNYSSAGGLKCWASCVRPKSAKQRASEDEQRRKRLKDLKAKRGKKSPKKAESVKRANKTDLDF